MVPSRYTITRKEAKIDLQTGKLPAQVVKLAKSLARPTEDATIASIRSYLKGHYLYSLSTHAAGPAGDTVDDFLFHSRTGYCVQFATAFVILARLDGIPARYVTGFLVYLPQHSRSTIVTGLSAHAWAEVWDRRKGWTTVEATPPMIAADFSDPQFYSRFNPTGSSATKRELEAVLGNRIPVKGKHEAHGGHTRRVSAGQRRGGSASGRIPVAVGAGVLLALILLVTARRLAPPEKRLKRLLRRMARRSRRRGLPDPSAQGWSSWALALARLHPARQAVAQRAGAVILSRFFAGNLRTERDLRFLTRFYRRVFAQPATRSRVERQAPSRS